MLRGCCGTLLTGRRAPLGRTFNDGAVLELPFPWLSLFNKRAVLLVELAKHTLARFLKHALALAPSAAVTGSLLAGPGSGCRML